MKHIALLLATVAALALPGAAFAQRAHGPVHAPAFHRAPALGPRPPVADRRPPGLHRRHHRPHFNNFGWGWPLFMPPPGEANAEIVTREFIDPRIFPPRPPRIDVLKDEPLGFREPPHIIYLGRHKRHRPIIVVRRGVISRE